MLAVVEPTGFPIGRPYTLINDIFMALFFGIAAKEITESVLPGGALNPPSKAVNPLLGTIGGIVGPAGFYLICVFILVTSPEQIGVASGVFGSTSPEHIIAGQHWSDAPVGCQRVGDSHSDRYCARMVICSLDLRQQGQRSWILRCSQSLTMPSVW